MFKKYHEKVDLNTLILISEAYEIEYFKFISSKVFDYEEK